MNEDLTTESVSADEFGRQSIRRFVQRPGVVRLDTVREQADRINRMVSNKAPLLDHMQRYIPGESSGMYGERQLMTYAHPVNAKNIHAGADIQSPGAVKLQAAGQDMTVPSLSGNHIQRSVSNSSLAVNVSEPIIKRHLSTPMVMQKAQVAHSLISKATGSRISGGGNLVRSSTTPASSTPASVSATGTANQAGLESSTPAPDNVIQSKPDTNTAISDPMIKRHLSTPMIMQKAQVAHSLISKATGSRISGGGNLVRSSTTPASSTPASVSATCTVNRTGLESSTPAPDNVIPSKPDTHTAISDPMIKRHLSTPMIMQKAQVAHGLISKATGSGISGGSNLVSSSTTPASSTPVSVSAMGTANQARLESSTLAPDKVIQRKKEVSNKMKNGSTGIGSPQNLGSAVIQHYADMAVTNPMATMHNDSRPDSSSKLMTTAAHLLQKKESSPISVGLQRSSAMPETDDDSSAHAVGIQTGTGTPVDQEKTILSNQISVLPVAETSRNQSTRHVVSVKKNQPNTTGSLKEYAGLKQHVQFNHSTPSLPVTNATSTGKMVFRKQADVVASNGDIQNARNNSNSYTSHITMPVVTAVNRTSEENISRAVDYGVAASNEDSSTLAAQAVQSEIVTPYVTDEMIEKIFSRLLRRMAVEGERKGWRS